MRSVPLTTAKGGINRSRTKGGARADDLYDLVNGHLQEDGSVTSRPGSDRYTTLTSATKGLCSFQGDLHVFSHATTTVPTGYVLHVIASPDSTSEVTVALEKIHFAKPFMGFLYVVAEFEDGGIYHYWLQSAGAWQASKVYRNGDMIEPTIPNGIAYLATRQGAPNPLWTAGAERAVGDKVEPTEYNGYYFTVVDTAGATPASGQTEPTWPTEEGAQVTENTDTTPEDAAGSATDDTQVPGSDITDRYDF